jgi:hypothetical protein
MVLAEADRVIMMDDVLELGEHVFISERDAERVDVDVAVLLQRLALVVD